ncbi:MAG TPA: adenosine-specific kinase [Patescibacteria group bacterium]|nr:adenosine-specific kinase [Patescibacteria group bacterium]
MDIKNIAVHNPEAKNFIFGQSHFIKTVEDLHETLAESVPGIKFGLAFCEASGPQLVRTSGTDKAMIDLAAKNALTVAAGHTFFIFLENAFPINVLSAIKNVSEVVTIFCATANPTEVIVAETKLGRGVLGVIDGGTPKGTESKVEEKKRKEFLRTIGYKL